MPASMKLSSHTLISLPACVSTPSYARDKLRTSIVHIGVGNFHRSHLATYVDDLCRLGCSQWAITGAGVLASDAAMAAALRSQDMLFTVAERGADSTSVRVIGSMVSYIHAHPDASELIRIIAAPDTQVVSITITEGGYPVDDESGTFDSSSPAAAEGTAFDILCAGLDARRKAGTGPLTVLSCDNIVGNGIVSRIATLSMAERRGKEVVEWIQKHVSFPNSMVDRITPATTAEDKEFLRNTYDVDDEWPVITEDFRQWVIEDNFAGDRIPLELLDVLVVKDVAPYEKLKLRLLNAGHCCLAYPAAVLGIDLVHEALGDDDIVRLTRAFMAQEAAPVLEAVPGIDVREYIELLIRRFANPAVRDQVARLCLDGSAKLPKFLFPTIRAQIARGGQIDICALILATWCRYLVGKTEHGVEYQVSADPIREKIVRHAVASWNEQSSFIDFEIFGEDLAQNRRLLGAFERALQLVRTQGVRSTIAQVLKSVLEEAARTE